MAKRLLALVDPIAAPTLVDDQLPEWIHVVPFGEWRGHRVGPFTVGAKEAAEFVASFEAAGGRHVVIDYEHQTLHTKKNGKPAPAMGWIDRLEVRSDGVWGHIESWTERGASLLRKREYRYLSPVLAFNHINKRSGLPEGAFLHSAALTNVPFLDELKPVVLSDGHHPEESDMDELRKLLGLSDDATDDEVLAAVRDLRALRDHVVVVIDGDTHQDSAALQAALSELAPAAAVAVVVAEELEVALSDIDADALRRELRHSGYVTIDEHVAALRDGEQREVALTDEQIVAKAKADGKLTPVLETWFCKQLQRDREGAMGWLEGAPVVVPLRSQVGDPPTPKSRPRLTETERQVAAQLALSDDAFLAAKES